MSSALATFARELDAASQDETIALDALISRHISVQRHLAKGFGAIASAVLPDSDLFEKTRSAIAKRMSELFEDRAPSRHLSVPPYGAMQRKILRYLAANVGKAIEGASIRVITAEQIHSERRLRELRDLGFTIGVETRRGESIYTLESLKPDLDYAARFALEHSIKKDSTINATQKMFQLLKAELGRPVNTKRLQHLSGNQSQYDRRIRSLRETYSISTGLNRAGIGPDDYLLESLEEKDKADQFTSKTIATIFRRDGYRCQDCGWTRGDPQRGGRGYLEAHHKTHRAEGGKSDLENGITLCNVCHDARHAELKGKKGRSA
jgi:hypothetical protein